MNGILDTSEMARLLTLVEEAARSTEEGVKHFVEPAPGTLQRPDQQAAPYRLRPAGIGKVESATQGCG